MRQRFWELGGSRMGEAMGIKAEGDDPALKKEEEAEGEYDYRKENKFSDHLKEIKKEVRQAGGVGQSEAVITAGQVWI